MSKTTLWFVRSSLVYFGIGVLLGISMAVYPSSIQYLRFAHIHVNLLGWISMMIFGVSYHVFPRFSGKQLWSEKLAQWHFMTAHTGLIGMVVCYPFRPLTDGMFIAFASIEVLSVFMFLLNMFKTLQAES